MGDDRGEARKYERDLNLRKNFTQADNLILVNVLRAQVFSHSLSTDQLWSILSIVMEVYDSEAGFIENITAEYEQAE